MYVLMFVIYSPRDIWGPFHDEDSAWNYCESQRSRYIHPHPRTDKGLYSVMPLTDAR